jgi:alpha-mannosidase
MRKRRAKSVKLNGWFMVVMFASETVMADRPRFDLSKDKVLYCVGYAHLDTQWRWDFCTTIDKYIRDTLDRNFARFEQFPGYVFNFTGTVRYEMMKEYYPEKYEQLKKYVAQGRWCVSGSSVDEGDVNVPSPEAIIRHVLYGNDFFRREFGKESVDFMLPDCFGFPASMPSIWAHCGLKGFSTQKLTWGSAVGIPFKIGVWEGPDGKSVLAAFDPGPYVGAIQGRVDTNPEWVRRVTENGTRYGVWADYHYYGVGDQGGAPREEDIRNYLASIDNPDSQIKVALVSSDQMFRDINDVQKARLPRYRGDLLLTEHSSGTLTSQSYMKRWNRKNEILADAAERAAVAAHWLGGAAYPREKLYRSWVRLLANQMHDILPGTSIPRAYTYSWNDEVVAMNGFAEVLNDSTGAVVRALDTRTRGFPLIVYNPLAIEREDVVEAEVRIHDADAPSICVFSPQDKQVPTQVVSRDEANARILFLAKTAPVSWSVFDVRGCSNPLTDETGLQVSEKQLENEHYRVSLDENGDVSSIVDKSADGRELLAAPAKLVFTFERPQQWPAWNMDWADRRKPPIASVTGPAKVRVVERGPVRVALEIEREARGSVFRQRIALSRRDAGRRVEFHTEVDWQSVQCALKASFPMTVANPKAVYNWGLGTIERGNNEPTKYEVPAHEWFDLTDVSGEYGVSILDDCKYGSDKPSDHEVRLTLLYTPGVRHGYLDQHSQDWGRHEFVYALFGHRGDWRAGGTEGQARRLNQPLRVWRAPASREPLGSTAGQVGHTLSLTGVNTTQIDVRAVKLEEHSDRVVLRLQELWGRDATGVEVSLAFGMAEAQEIDGQERPIGKARIRNGKLLTQFSPYQPRSFVVRPAAPPVTVAPPTCQPLTLDFDADVVSRDGNVADGGFDAEGRTIPAEMLPERILCEGIEFVLGPTADGRPNALRCRGQTIHLPGGAFDRIYLLAAADDDVPSRLFLDDQEREWSVQSWTGFVGQWDDRVWDREFGEVDHRCQGNVVGLRTGFIKRDPIAWFCTHRHHPRRGNEAYRFSYLFKYGFDLSRPVPGSGRERTLRLPDDPRIKVLAATLARNVNDAVTPAAPLYDDFTDRNPIQLRHVYPPPPTPVFEGITPLGRSSAERKSGLGEPTIEPALAADYADQASGRGALFRFFDGDGDFRPHSRAGAQGDALPRLNDGRFARNDDDTERCVWFDNEGRFFIDLQQPVRVKRIDTYSWHRDNRAPQKFSVWASDAAEMPSPAFRHGEHGAWTLLAVVNTKSLGEGGIHLSSIQPPPDREAFEPYRYLLWIAEDVGQGTFFTEIDIHIKP